MAEKTIVEQVAQEVLDLLASRGALKNEVEGLEKKVGVVGKELSDKVTRLDKVKETIEAAIQTKANADKETIGAVKEAAKAKSECRKAWADEKEAAKKEFDQWKREKEAKNRALTKKVKDKEELLIELDSSLANIKSKVA